MNASAAVCLPKPRTSSRETASRSSGVRESSGDGAAIADDADDDADEDEDEDEDDEEEASLVGSSAA